MPMKFVTGDIALPCLDYSPTLICLPVNCKGVMSRGLQKHVKDKYPSVYREYRMQCNNNTPEDLMGTVFISDTGYADTKVACLFCYKTYIGEGRYTNIPSLEKALESLGIMASGGITVRVPYRLGCGLGDTKWGEIRNIIDRFLLSLNVDVEIWEEGR